MKKILVIALALITFSLSAIEYDLGNYEVPEYKTYGLSADFDLSTEISSNETENDSTSFESTKIKYAIPYLDFDSYRFWRMDDMEMKFVFGSSGKTSFYREEDDILEVDNSYGSFSTYGSGEYKKYIWENFFIGTSDRIDFDYSQRSLENNYLEVDSTYSSNLYSRKYKTEYELNFGFGRRNYVNNAYRAYLILEKFEEKGIIAKDLSDKDIEDFADKLTKLSIKNYLDNREKQMQIIQELETYFNDKNLVQEKGAFFYTTLHDYIFDYNFPARYNGYEVTKSIIYNLEKENLDEEKYHHDRLSEEIINQIYFKYYNPITLKWDFNSNFLMSYTKRFNRNESTNNSEENISKFNYNLLTLSGEFELVNYINTRTTWINSCLLTSSHYLDYGDTEKHTETILNLNSEFDFYLNKNLLLFSSINFSNKEANYFHDQGYLRTYSNFDFDFSIGLRYNLFDL